MRTQKKKRLITVQGPIQLINVVSTLCYEKDRYKDISYNDTLCVYGLHSEKLSEYLLLLKEVWTWSSVVILSEKSKYSSHELRSLVGENFHEIYLCRNYMHYYDKQIMATYHNAYKISYGDGLGFIEMNQFPATIPFDMLKFVIGIEQSKNAISNKVYQITPLKYTKTLIDRILQLDAIRTPISSFFTKIDTFYKNHQKYLITLANLTETKYTSNIEKEIKFYSSFINGAIDSDNLKESIFIIKPHPRETLNQSQLLQDYLRTQNIESVVIDNAISLLPVELFFSKSKELCLIPILSSSSLNVKLLFNSKILIETENIDDKRFNYITMEHRYRLQVYIMRLYSNLAHKRLNNTYIKHKDIDFTKSEALPKSPLTKKNNVRMIKKNNLSDIASNYIKNFNVLTGSYFYKYDTIGLYECVDTKYSFFYPYDVAGDGEFYAQLQEFDWYYMPWKWEHQEAAKEVKPGMKVLEVGSAKGDFLKRLKEDYDAEVTGLELNEKAAKEAQQRGLEVHCEFVQDHAMTHPETYDLVCSFQVLEHIAEVHSFLEAKVKCLKPGGKLIICVPNNDGFLKIDSRNVLNKPPHHMGLWGEESLRSLSKLFSLQVDRISLEPIQPQHEEWHRKVYENYFLDCLSREGRMKKWVNRLPSFLEWRVRHYGPKLYYRLKRNKKVGHSILVSYTKL